MPESSDLSLMTDRVGKGWFSMLCHGSELIGSGITRSAHPTTAAKSLKVGSASGLNFRRASMPALSSQDLWCCATIKTPRPATIRHTSDGRAAFGRQVGVKPEAARGGGPKGQALHQLDSRT